VEKILTIREVADLLKINEKTVYKLAAAAKIPGTKVGGSWRFDRATISAWLRSKSAVDSARATDGFQSEAGRVTEDTLAVAHYSPQQGTFFAHRVTLEGIGEHSFTQSLSTARVDMNPHQVDAALFALASPLSKGVLLADEVGLGKTIEASLVIAQRWAERKRRILLIVPASLRKQWSQELYDKFSLPSAIVERKSYNDLRKKGIAKPFERADHVVITSYEFAAQKNDEIHGGQWDLVVFDEAHRLRNAYKKDGATRAKRLRDATRPFFKILLTATPLQNSLMELYGLVSVLDEHHFGDEDSFRSQYVLGSSARNGHIFLRRRLEPICKRTLRRQVQQAGLIRYTERSPLTMEYSPSKSPQPRGSHRSHRRCRLRLG
jgi:excisionase family DNA binding protein